MPAAGPRCTIVVDTREQAPYCFGGRVETVRLGLETGDYSLLGHETTIAIERKTLEDFVGSLTWGRDRFLRECERLTRLAVRAIVVEGSFGDVVHAKYRSEATPQSIVGSTIKLLTDFGLPVVFADCREYAERLVERMLTRHWEHARKAARAAEGDAHMETQEVRP
jgi:ERCC4-type nuclease